MPIVLWQVTSDHFCAGLVSRGGSFLHGAPILDWAVRQRFSLKAFARYCRSKNWRLRFVGADV